VASRLDNGGFWGSPCTQLFGPTARPTSARFVRVVLPAVLPSCIIAHSPQVMGALSVPAAFYHTPPRYKFSTPRNSVDRFGNSRTLAVSSFLVRLTVYHLGRAFGWSIRLPSPQLTSSFRPHLPISRWPSLLFLRPRRRYFGRAPQALFSRLFNSPFFPRNPLLLLSLSPLQPHLTAIALWTGNTNPLPHCANRLSRPLTSLLPRLVLFAQPRSCFNLKHLTSTNNLNIPNRPLSVYHTNVSHHRLPCCPIDHMNFSLFFLFSFTDAP